MHWWPNPPRDGDGNVLPHDDPATIPGEWTLLRHVNPEQWAPDERTGSCRPHSNAFMFSSTGSCSMSVDIEPPMVAAGIPSLLTMLSWQAKESSALRPRRHGN